MTESSAGEAVADRRVHPATIPLRFVKEAPSTLVGLPAAYGFVSERGLGEILFVAGAIAIVAMVLQWLRWHRFRYGVGSRDLVIESGILSRTRRSIPVDRIQDVDIERGPLARLFGLAKVRIETGGSAADEGLLDSVTVAEAERIRAALRSARRDAQVPSEHAPEKKTLVFSMSTPRVLAAGLFNFSLVYLASLFAFLQTFDRWLPFDVYDPGRWIGLVDRRIASGWSAGAIAAVALVAVGLGVVLGVARTLARDFGFRLSAEAEGVRRERGLFTRTEAILPERRIQIGFLQTGPIRRFFGWYSLSIQTLGGRGPGETGRQSVAPLARREEVASILAACGSLRPSRPEELRMVSTRHFLRRFAQFVLFPAAILIPASFVSPFFGLFLAFLPVLALIAFLERRFHRYGLAGGILFIEAGCWRQRQWIVPAAKIQSIRLERSLLQRRFGLATLLVDTAGAPVLDPPRILDVREEEARALIAALKSA